MAPSQPLAAVAGVQLESRQHRVPSPLFHWRLPWPLRQLSFVAVPLEGAAKAAVAMAAVANNIATEFSFFMVFLLE
jgi:hypothetical protein